MRFSAFGVLYLFAAISWNAPASAHLTFRMKPGITNAIAEVATEGMRTIYASGTISNGDTERFLHFVSQKKLEAAKVAFDSPGGSLLEGVKLGTAIRQLRFFTAVGAISDGYGKSHSICASACAYAFAGGVSRFLDTSSGKLGIHQFSSEGAQLSEGDVQVVSGMLVTYLRDMGVDTEAFAVAAATNADGITWLTPEQAEELGFANNGLESTTAEIKIVGMHPYLRLNQNSYNVTIRVLFYCENNDLIMGAGIVTNPEQSSDIADPSWQKRSYIEMDGHDRLVVDGAAGATAEQSVVWLKRRLTKEDAESMLATDTLGVWVDGHGAVRMGGTIDLTHVRPTMKTYFNQCLR